MAITNTWSVSDMQHMDSDGGVFLVYWSMVAQSDGTPSYTASEGGKLRCEYDASSPSFVPYADLTESDVLGWVYTSLIEGDETADEAKARVEADRMRKYRSKLMPLQRLRLACLGNDCFEVVSLLLSTLLLE
jgi:hypothetical protein